MTSEYTNTMGLMVDYRLARLNHGTITSLRFLPHDLLRGQTYGCNDSLTYEYGYVHGDRFFFQ